MAGDSGESVSTLINTDVDESGDVGVATPAKLVGYHIHNGAAVGTQQYVKLYNTATAPTVGTDTPLMTLGVEGGSQAVAMGMVPILFSAGIGLGATTAAALGDTGAPSANDVCVTLYYLDIG